MASRTEPHICEDCNGACDNPMKPCPDCAECKKRWSEWECKERRANKTIFPETFKP